MKTIDLYSSHLFINLLYSILTIKILLKKASAFVFACKLSLLNNMYMFLVNNEKILYVYEYLQITMAFIVKTLSIRNCKHLKCFAATKSFINEDNNTI